MKLEQVLTESEITELGLAGVARGAAAAGKGLARGAAALGRGAATVGRKAVDIGKNAASSYRANKQMGVGRTHAANIIKNLGQEYLRMVGGGEQPTLQSLKSYLNSVGLGDLDQLDALVAGLGNANPNSLMSQGMAVLKNKDIQNLIKRAVELNYAKIRAAQQGRAQPAAGPAAAPSQQSQTNTVPNNPFNNPKDLAKAWNDYIKAGGKVNKRIKNLIATMNASIQAAPSNQGPVPESKTYSKFLGQSL